MCRVLRVGIRNQDTAVVHKHGCEVVQTRNRRVGHDCHARADGLPGIVKKGIMIRVCGESKTGINLLGAVEDEIYAVRKGNQAAYDALRGYTLQFPLGVGRIRLEETQLSITTMAPFPEPPQISTSRGSV